MKTSRALVAGATVVGVLAPSASVNAAAVPSEPVQACWTFALTPEEVDSGATSEIFCEPADQTGARSAPMSTSLSSTLLAVHHMGAGGSGSWLSIYGSDCNGGGVSFAAGSTWNDTISSTEHRLCPTVKHWEHSNYSGNTESTSGSAYQIVNLTSLNNAASAIQYF